jgi:hypothetical protein
MTKPGFNIDGMIKKKIKKSNKKEFVNMYNEQKEESKIPQGWQCPACKRINSPTSTSCPCLGSYPIIPYPYRPYIGDPPYYAPYPPYYDYSWRPCYDPNLPSYRVTC